MIVNNVIFDILKLLPLCYNVLTYLEKYFKISINFNFKCDIKFYF